MNSVMREIINVKKNVRLVPFLYWLHPIKGCVYFILKQMQYVPLGRIFKGWGQK